MANYYNDNEPFVCQWLRNLIAAGHLPAGDVDERSIVDVQPDDLRGYAQCHFFAGIGGWAYALRLAGWPDDRPVWTGSCPCQPFSVAGAQRGSNDERHLWPAWFRLIRECRPPAIFGEQVSGASGLAWLDHVCADLEGEGYAAAAADLPACSVGAPHIRQRLWWVANRETRRWSEIDSLIRWSNEGGGSEGSERPEHGGGDGSVADREGAGRETRRGDGVRIESPPLIGSLARGGGASCELGDTSSSGSSKLGRRRIESTRPAATGFWRDIEWLLCTDGKARPTQSGLFPLAHGLRTGGVAIGSAIKEPAATLSQEEAAHIFNRVGVLRGAGNAIVPRVAAEFVMAVMECMP